MKSLKTTMERKTADSCSFSFLILPALIFVFLHAAINVEISSAFIGSSSPPSDTSGRSMVTPDLFTGAISYGVPIDVPPGRKSMAPNLGITYKSNNGNGWVGVGWDLEGRAIERNVKYGVDYNGDSYILRVNGATIDLANIGNNNTAPRLSRDLTGLES